MGRENSMPHRLIVIACLIVQCMSHSISIWLDLVVLINISLFHPDGLSVFQMLSSSLMALAYCSSSRQLST